MKVLVPLTIVKKLKFITETKMNDNFSVSWKCDILKCKFHAFNSND